MTDAEVRKLASYVKMARKDGAIRSTRRWKSGVEAVLVSPYFLFRVERDPASGGDHRISDYELASRLSYFLWSSMPDAELFALGEGIGSCTIPRCWTRQVTRMLKDPKSEALVENFGRRNGSRRAIWTGFSRTRTSSRCIRRRCAKR